MPLPNDIKQRDNLSIWDRVCATDPGRTKDVRYGQRKFTAVCPIYQSQQATKLFGPYGTGWFLDDFKWELIQTEHADTLCLDCRFYYTYEGTRYSFPISADMPFKSGDDCRKKLRTSCQSKALSLLGFSADVFAGLFDDVAYVAQRTAQVEEDATRERVMAFLSGGTDADAIRVNRQHLDRRWGEGAISDAIYEDGVKYLEERLASLETKESEQP